MKRKLACPTIIVNPIIVLAFLFSTVSISLALTPPETLSPGATLPSAILIGSEGNPVDLESLKGRVKILSMVPKLNTPVCDEQTHRFSEQNEGLDQFLDIVTISTNPSNVQTRFSEKANIHNMTFLSDFPAFDFGEKTGLLLPERGILHRAVIVADAENVITYVEMVPLRQLPHFEGAFEAARQILKRQRP